MPRVLLGVGLVVVCALVFAVLATRSASPVRVLALARDVAAGQVLSSADLTTVEVSGRGAMVPGLVPVAQEQDWVGRTLTGPLPAGQLLTPANLGPSAWPPAGQAVVAVPIQEGRLPAGVVVGSQVRIVLPAPSASSASSAGGPVVEASQARTVAAAVVQIAGVPATGALGGGDASGSAGASAPAAGEGAVLSLLMSSRDATAVAAVAGGGGAVAVVLQGPGAGG